MSDDESINLPKRFAVAPFPGPLDSPPPSVDLRAAFGARSHRGAQRSRNDDHYLIVRVGRQQETLMTSVPKGDIPISFAERGYAMVIADGMGTSGEAASRLAISALAHLAIDFGKWNVRVNEPIAEEVMDRAERFYRSVDAMLLQESRERGDGLHTTLTAVYTAGADLFFAHVGHSRAYMFRDNELMQLTRDHGREAERRDAEMVVDIATRARGLRHIIAEALGRNGSSHVRLDIERCGLLDGDVVMLCTHGLTDVVDDGRIAEELRKHRTPDDQCRALIDLAVGAGGTDDVTVLIAHYRLRPRDGEIDILREA